MLQKVEGNVAFYTAMSTAFPQPAPGTAPNPGPMKVPAERLRSVEAARASDTQEYRHNLPAVEARLEEERTHHVRAEADLAKQETGRQSMERALDGHFPRVPFF